MEIIPRKRNTQEFLRWKDTYLHTDDRVDEKQHRYEETNVRQSLEWKRLYWLKDFNFLNRYKIVFIE